jgi:outer membrane protein TolC
MLEVRERFYAVLLTRSWIAVQEENLRVLREELEYARTKLRAGTVSPFEALRAEVALANGQTPYIRAKNVHRLALEELARTMGLSGSGGGETPPLTVEGELTMEPYAADLDAECRAALADRPELKRLMLVAEAQAEGLRAAHAGNRPDLAAVAGYGWQRDPAAADRWDEVSGWTAGLRLAWPLFDGWGTAGRTRQAASEAALARLDLGQTRLNIEVEVRRAHSSLIDATELVNATAKVVEQAVESLRLARSRHDAGAATQLDVLTAQAQLTEARNNQVQALHDYALALARLRRAMGVAEPFPP